MDVVESIPVLAERIAELEAELREENAAKKRYLAETVELRGELEAMDARRLELAAQVAQLEGQVEEMRQPVHVRLQQRTDEVITLQRDVLALRETRFQQSEEIEKLESRIFDAENDLDDKEAELEAEKTRTATLEQQLGEITEHRDQLLTERADLLVQIDEVQHEFDELIQAQVAALNAQPLVIVPPSPDEVDMPGSPGIDFEPPSPIPMVEDGDHVVIALPAAL